MDSLSKRMDFTAFFRGKGFHSEAFCGTMLKKLKRMGKGVDKMKQGHPMRRADRLVSEEKAGEIMENAEYAVLMTADREGQPYGVAVSHVADGDKIYFHCAADAGRKLENIRQNPKVCVSCVQNTFVDEEKYTHRYESAVAEGTAVIVEDEEEKLHALRLIAKKYAPDSFKDADAYILPRMKETGVVRVDMETLSGKVNAR